MMTTVDQNVPVLVHGFEIGGKFHMMVNHLNFKVQKMHRGKVSLMAQMYASVVTIQ